MKQLFWFIILILMIGLTIFKREFKGRGMDCCQFYESKFFDNSKKRDRAILTELLEILKKHTNVIKLDEGKSE